MATHSFAAADAFRPYHGLISAGKAMQKNVQVKQCKKESLQSGMSLAWIGCA